MTDDETFPEWEANKAEAEERMAARLREYEESKAQQAQQGHPGSPRDTFREGDTPQPEDLASLLDEVADFNRQFIFHKDESTHHVVALWVAHTYGMDKWYQTPRLYISAPQRGVGKSTQGEVIKLLSNNGIKAASATPAAIFAEINQTEGKVTILLDEADNIWAKGRDTRDLQSLVNDGFEPGAMVLRGNATDQGIVSNRYPAYCPVAIIGIKNSYIPETTLSRCLPINMTPPPSSWKRVRFAGFREAERANLLGEKLSLAMKDVPQYEEIPEPTGMGLREWDTWLPLFVIAKHAGGPWPERVEEACRKMSETGEVVLSLAQKVLKGAYEYFMAGGETRVTPLVLATYLVEAGEMYPEDTEQKLSMKLSHALGKYVESRKTNGVRYFYVEDVVQAMEEWLPQYLSPSQKVTLGDPSDPVNTSVTSVTNENERNGMNPYEEAQRLKNMSASERAAAMKRVREYDKQQALKTLEERKSA